MFNSEYIWCLDVVVNLYTSFLLIEFCRKFEANIDKKFFIIVFMIFIGSSLWYGWKPVTLSFRFEKFLMRKR
jgi:hypothetical protein